MTNFDDIISALEECESIPPNALERLEHVLNNSFFDQYDEHVTIIRGDIS